MPIEYFLSPSPYTETIPPLFSKKKIWTFLHKLTTEKNCFLVIFSTFLVLLQLLLWLLVAIFLLQQHILLGGIFFSFSINFFFFGSFLLFSTFATKYMYFVDSYSFFFFFSFSIFHWCSCIGKAMQFNFVFPSFFSRFLFTGNGQSYFRQQPQQKQ